MTDLPAPLSPSDAQRVIREAVEGGQVVFVMHAEEEIASDLLDTWDVQNVLLGGHVGAAYERGGAWRYRVSTERLTVVVEIEDEDGQPEIIVVTGWRNEK